MDFSWGKRGDVEKTVSKGAVLFGTLGPGHLTLVAAFDCGAGFYKICLDLALTKD